MHYTSNNIRVSQWVFHPRLRRDHNAQIVLIYLCTLASEHYPVRASFDVISRALGMKRGQVRCAIDRLVRNGIISKKTLPAGNVFTIDYDDKTWEDYASERLD
jgi:hypothetical protein